MMKRFNLFNLLGIIMIILVGFTTTTDAQGISTKTLDLMFYDYKVVNIDSRSVHNTSRNNHFFIIDIPKPNNNGYWSVELHNSGIISDDYVSQYVTDKGVLTGERTSAVPTKGHVVGDLSTTVSLTFNEGFIYGFIKDKTGYNYVEPVSYYEKGQRGSDLFVVYNAKDIKPTAPHMCGNTEMSSKTKEMIGHAENIEESRLDECFEVEYAIANDFLMFQDFGSVFATEDHAIGVTNNVQTNYDDEFADELQYIIVTQFTVSSANGDPWSDTVNGSDLLAEFRVWGNSGGFGAIYDVASLWTSRNFFAIINGQQAFGVIGIASVGAICTNFRYNILENFTNNAQQKRVLVAHELGHNWSSFHDPANSGFIMAPSVNNTNLWSTQSINSINNHISTRTCLADCSNSSGGPVASFDFNVIEDCTPGIVQFTSTSTGGANLDFEWEFQGGTPSFSTAQNPLVTYNEAGTFNVTLTVTNTSGSDEIIENGIIDIEASPAPDFGYAIDGTTVSFFNISENAVSYFWDFGDGATSFNSDPVHDFLDDGVYTVILTASSPCGDESKEEIIVIANPPTAEFEADVQLGCAPLTVQFTSNASNNTDEFNWVFEGGDPATSTEENPVVTYNEGGDFDVSLTVENETGDDVLEFIDFITVSDVPVADFSFVINENEVTFTNFSTGAESFVWDFGDSNSSTEESPVHTFGGDGEFEVELTATNECGENSASTTITISLEPVASFQTSQEPTDCATFVLDFESTSTNNPDEYEWVFEGGNPATSSMANPSVTYSESGTYDVTLTVSNANGSNSMTMTDFVEVLGEPISAFTFSEDGLTVNFIDGSEDSDSYAWDFGDSNTSTDANPIHTYSAEGVYTVELTVTNECGTNTSSQTINNYTPVTADFSSDISAGCANLIVEFGDQSSGNVTEWLWTFEGGMPATSTDENPTVTYDQAGQYDVVLTVSHPQSTETITLVNYVAVSDVPMASFDFFDDLFVVDFTNTSIEGDSYSWDFGDSESSTDENPTHTYTSEGVYEVILTATNACGSTTSSAMVTINALPTAGLNSDISSGCGPLTVQFNDASSSNVTDWAWTFEGGSPATSTEENPTVEYATAGMYKVELLVTSAAGTDMIVLDDFVEVKDGPTAEIDFALDGNLLTALNIGSGATSVTWKVDNTESVEDELSYTLPANGIFSVELIAENECGTDTETIDVTIDVYPEVSLGGLPLSVCVGEEIQIVDNSSNADVKEWTLEGANPGTSTEDNPIVVYSDEGIYSITLMVSNQYGDATETYTDAVTVTGLPTASFVGTQVDNMVEFESNASNTSTYLWDFGDGNTSDEINPTHTFTTNGTFEVKLTVSNICGDFFTSETFTIITNSLSEAELGRVNIYPNPARSILNIELPNTESDMIEMDVLDINGKLVMSKAFNVSTYTLDVSNLNGGTYLIRLRSEETSYYKKVVILK